MQVNWGNTLWAAVDRPNVFIKIPVTEEGIPAIRQSPAKESISTSPSFSADSVKPQVQDRKGQEEPGVRSVKYLVGRAQISSLSDDFREAICQP